MSWRWRSILIFAMLCPTRCTGSCPLSISAMPPRAKWKVGGCRDLDTNGSCLEKWQLFVVYAVFTIAHGIVLRVRNPLGKRWNFQVINHKQDALATRNKAHHVAAWKRMQQLNRRRRGRHLVANDEGNEIWADEWREWKQGLRILMSDERQVCWRKV